VESVRKLEREYEYTVELRVDSSRFMWLRIGISGVLLSAKSAQNCTVLIKTYKHKIYIKLSYICESSGFENPVVGNFILHRFKLRLF
jgi:hypothetical protein